MIRKVIIIILLLFSVAILILGIISFWKPISWNCLRIEQDLDDWMDTDKLVWIEFDKGQILLVYQNYFYGTERHKHWFKNLPGIFRIIRSESSLTTTASGQNRCLIILVWNVYIYFWWPFLLCSIYPAIAFIRGPFRRYRRRKKGLCLNCGYNLTGNVSGVCPECGGKI